MTVTRWLFGDQLGPHFLDDHDGPVLLVESTSVLRRRRFHRAKAHLVLTALRARAEELGDRCTYVRADTYAEALQQVRAEVEVVAPTTYAARRLVERLGVTVLPSRGFATAEADFATWAQGRRSLLMEDFYRWARRSHGVLMDGDQPAGGQWNLDHDNRQPPPRDGDVGVEEPWWPGETEVDERVRHDLDRLAGDGVAFVGSDGPRRFAATRAEAEQALERFLRTRLAAFGPVEDAMLAGDGVLAHSLLSPAMNLGLLDPLECARAAEAEFRAGRAPLNSVEGYVRQLIGWRDYVWHVYWHTGEDYRARNFLEASEHVPDWLWDLDAGAVTANCLRTALEQVRDWGWTHHIPRLMLLGGWALQRGVRPDELTAWFHHSFVDGYDWVMVPNVVGMSQHADGGFMATKPYASGGAYFDRMSDYCGGCRYDPKQRVGPDACPYTAGYWSFLDRIEDKVAANRRMRQPLAGLSRLKDRAEVVEQETRRGTSPP